MLLVYEQSRALVQSSALLPIKSTRVPLPLSALGDPAARSPMRKHRVPSPSARKPNSLKNRAAIHEILKKLRIKHVFVTREQIVS